MPVLSDLILSVLDQRVERVRELIQNVMHQNPVIGALVTFLKHLVCGRKQAVALSILAILSLADLKRPGTIRLPSRK